LLNKKLCCISGGKPPFCAEINEIAPNLMPHPHPLRTVIGRFFGYIGQFGQDIGHFYHYIGQFR
jgi:hypothetical protein